MKRVYISGPIAGKEDGNRDEFKRAAEWLDSLGFEPINPHDIAAYSHEGECPKGYAFGNGHSSACWLRGDLAVLLECDAMYMLDGWPESRGAMLELNVAQMCGIPVFKNPQAFDRWSGVRPR